MTQRWGNTPWYLQDIGTPRIFLHIIIQIQMQWHVPHVFWSINPSGSGCSIWAVREVCPSYFFGCAVPHLQADLSLAVWFVAHFPACWAGVLKAPGQDPWTHRWDQSGTPSTLCSVLLCLLSSSLLFLSNSKIRIHDQSTDWSYSTADTHCKTTFGLQQTTF